MRSGTTGTASTYEPFGATVSTGAASSNPFFFTGREQDASGLSYYRARYYSPRLGRFLSEDPIRIGGGDLNFYAYVSNAPSNSIDPLGMLVGPLDTSKTNDPFGALDALVAVRGTERGAELYWQLQSSSETYLFRFVDVGDSVFIPSTREIIINMKDSRRVFTIDGCTPATPVAILAHELGHASRFNQHIFLGGRKDELPNIETNENPIRAQLNPKQPLRVQYEQCEP